MNSSRREFLHQLAALPLIPLRQSQVQLVLLNANILTMDDSQPRAQAVAISDGRLVAVGSNEEISGLATSRTTKVDLTGRTVVPGFIDAHSHPCYAGLRHLRQVDCDLRSISDIQNAIRQRAAQTPPGNWVLGFKYDDTKTSDARPLTREDLDSAAASHPVRIEHRGGHTAYVNSLALKMAGVSEATPDPAGGRFDRDPTTGRLNGRVSENARGTIENLIPSTYSREDYREAVKLISQMMSKTGITSVHDAQGSPADLRGYQDAYEAGELTVRVYCLIDNAHIDRMLEAGIRPGWGNE